MPTSARAEAPAINHDAVGCIVVDQFPRLEARFDPAENVSRGRLLFRPAGGAHWYSVPMTKELEAFVGVLPKPTAKLKSLDYYVEVTATDFATGRTREYAPEVVSGIGACQGDKITAGSLTSASIILEVPAGAPAVPAGFSSAGVSTLGATAGSQAAASAGGLSAGATTAGATGATAGGISSAAIIIGAAAAAAGVAVAVAAGGGNDSSNDPPTTTPPGPPPTTLPPPLTGTWTGTLLETDTRLNCTANWRLTLNLTEASGNLNGDLRLDGISATNPCAGNPGCVIAGNGGGSIAGTAVNLSFALVYTSPGGQMSRPFTWALSGNISADRKSLTGTWVDPSAPTVESGTWSATRP